MKKHTSSPQLRTVAFMPILILCMVVFTHALDHCSVMKQHETIGLLNNESVSITLGDYIRGYDLDYTTSKPMNAKTLNPLNTIGSVEFNFEQNYQIVNADVRKGNCKKWFQEGVVFAQKDTKNIGLVLTKFTGTNSPSEVLEHQYYTLDVPANCFSAKVVDAESNVVVDCQTANPANVEDYVCFISTKDKKVKSCLRIDSLNEVKDRKSEILYLGNRIYLLTASYSREKDSNEMTYLTVYYVDPVRGTVEFANIIDGYQLGLDYDITISDFKVMKGGQIAINDASKSQVFIVEYTLANQINVVGKPWVHGSEVTEIAVSDVDTLLVATKTHVEEWDLDLQAQVFRYELPKTDNDVTSISVSTYTVVVSTSRNTIYTYQRIMSPANYILGTAAVSSNKYLLSPYSNILYTFNEKEYGMHELTSGSLTVSNINESQNITITAQSETATCSFTLEVIALESSSKILTKQNIGQKKFVAQASQVLNFNLEEIFSGQNLRFNVPKSTDEVKYTLEQLSQFTVKTDLKEAPMRQVVAVNKTSFLQLGLWSTQAYLELCVANDKDLKIECQNIYSSGLSAQNPLFLVGKQRKSGQVVFVWASENTAFEMLTYNENGKIGKVYVVDGSGYEYSSVVIGEDRIYLTMKQYAKIKIVMDVSSGFRTVDIDAESMKWLNHELEGFYPREVYLHPRNRDLFYAKFPMHLCLMTLIGWKPKAIDCVQVFDRIIPDEQWSVVIGLNSFVVVSTQQITEYSVMGKNSTVLHSVTLSSPIVFPVFYNQLLNTVILSTQNSQMVYYKLNKPIIDCIYYETQVKSEVGKINNANDMISADGYWALNSLGSKAFRQSSNTKLSVEIVGDSKSFKEDLNIAISVKGKEEEIQIDDNVTVIKYRTAINTVNQTNNIITLPNNPSPAASIPINISEYFTGPRASYHIVCDYCDDTIKLQSLYQNKSTNDGLYGSARSIAQLPNNYLIVLTTSNMLYLISKDEKLQVKVTHKIKNEKACAQMAWSENLGLVVLCTDANGQEMVQFSVNETAITQWPGSFQLHEESFINNVNEIIISPISQTQFWILVQDNDASQQSLSKTANVKAFLLDGNTLQFKGLINSQTFNLQVNQPINDLEVKGGLLMVTIGNTGLGYGLLADGKSEAILMTPGVIQLANVAAIKAYLLDNTIFQQVTVLSVTATTASILVTSSTSIPMVLNITHNNGQNLQFSSVAQTYNRYGQLDSVNWVSVSDSVLLMKYYNSATYEEYIVGYDRKEKEMGDFVESLTRKISPKKSVEHSIFLTSEGELILSEPAQDGSSAFSRYQVSTQFSLWVSYEQAGQFSSMKLTTSNAYSSQTVEIPIQFQKDGSADDGVKWYTIFIIILIVLIICGSAYGMYLKMVKHRKDKKVSLLTEGEQVDEQI